MCGLIHLVDEDAHKDLPHRRCRIRSDRIGTGRNPSPPSSLSAETAEAARGDLSPTPAGSKHAPEGLSLGTRSFFVPSARPEKERKKGKVWSLQHAMATDYWRLFETNSQKQHSCPSIIGFSRHDQLVARRHGQPGARIRGELHRDPRRAPGWCQRACSPASRSLKTTC